jgi:D-alanyl-D-alanine carboxypeptidase (penicillin-binding protein 5/6)
MATALVAVLLAGLGWVTSRLAAPLPRASVHLRPMSAFLVSGNRAGFDWPAQGQAAVIVPSLMREPLAFSPGEHPVPIASLTKLMTAYLVLRQHPLRPGQMGPVLTISSRAVKRYENDVAEDQSSVRVAVGERLSEYQLLQALLVRSANNIANFLGDWVAGSLPAFVGQMNQMAARLGMTQTHYADASGFDPASVSTARDVAVIAAADMRNPVFRAIVDEHTVTLPLIGTRRNIVRRIGTGPVVGVKSGFTSQAGGCAVIATRLAVPLGVAGSTATATYVAVVLDQQGGGSLHRAASLAEGLDEQAAKFGPTSVVLVRAGTQVGFVEAPWLGRRRIPVVLDSGRTALAWPGQRVSYELSAVGIPRGKLAAGTLVGFLKVQWALSATTVRMRTALGLPSPSWTWRVFH